MYLTMWFYNYFNFYLLVTRFIFNYNPVNITSRTLSEFLIELVLMLLFTAFLFNLYISFTKYMHFVIVARKLIITTSEN